MAQEFSRRPLTAEERARVQFNPCGICGGQGGTGTDFLQVLRVFPVSIIPPWLHTHISPGG
jgi:hypothetical protein